MLLESFERFKLSPYLKKKNSHPISKWTHKIPLNFIYLSANPLFFSIHTTLHCRHTRLQNFFKTSFSCLGKTATQSSPIDSPVVNTTARSELHFNEPHWNASSIVKLSIRRWKMCFRCIQKVCCHILFWAQDCHQSESICSWMRRRSKSCGCVASHNIEAYRWIYV